MRVLVFENHWAGHRLDYLRRLLQAIGELGVEVVAAVPKGVTSRTEFRVEVASSVLPRSVTIEPCVEPPPGGQWRLTLHQWLELRRAVQRFRPDHLFVPSSDGLSQALGAFRSVGMPAFARSVESEAGLHLLSGAYPATGIARKAKVAVSFAALRQAPWSRLHVIDALAWERVNLGGYALARRAVVLPHPIEEPPPMAKHEARRRLGLPEDGRYVGCVGVMSRRKGIHLLMRAFARARLAPTDRLLLAGLFAPEMQAIVGSELASLQRQGRVIAIDRYLEPSELQTALAAMDVVCTPYAGHLGIASIMLQAVAARRPVLSSDWGWLGWVVDRFKIGSTFDLYDPGKFEAALGESLERSADFERGAGASRLLAFHHPSNFAASWTRRLRERLGLQADPAFLAWSDVAESTG